MKFFSKNLIIAIIVILSATGPITALAIFAPTPGILRVIKTVVNENGGSAVPSDFNIHVKLSGTDISGSPAVGVVAPGTLYLLDPHTYVVSEDENASYMRTFTGSGCDSNGNVTIAVDDDKTCIIINTYISTPTPTSTSTPALTPTSTPVLALESSPAIASGGSNRYIPNIGILKVPTPIELPAGPGLVTYNYTVWNIGGQEALINIILTDDKCAPVILLSGDLNSNEKIDPRERWEYSCATTLFHTTTNTAIATGQGDDGARQTATATAVATVVVAELFLPMPVIHIVKTPSRSTPFPFGGGDASYSYAVTNPGIVEMSNVVVTDDKCSPVSYLFGDVDSDNLLDPNETWDYACQTNISISTKNIARAQGLANGFTAVDYASATVLVADPAFPDTGLPPWKTNNIRNLIIVLISTSALAGLALINRRA